MKKIILTLSIAAVACNAFGAVTIKYYNRDSKSYKMVVKMDGSTKDVTFDASKTSTVTIQGGSTSCFIETSCGKVEVKDGVKVEIKDGCIKVSN